MRLSDSQLNQIRQQPQKTDLFLSIFTPKTIFGALISGSVRGARDITFYSTVTGSTASIEAGMTMLVGKTAGGRELGRIRVRGVSGSVVSVSENSHIDWASATHITVQRYWEVNPVYPRIISDPADAENVLWFKDYDIAYTDQNDTLGAFPCAGSHRALFAGEQSFWSSSGTSHLLGSALTYEWAFEGGNPTGSTSAVPGNVTYGTPGHYVTRLKVSGANGTLDTTYRYVSVYQDPRNSSANLPIRNWSLDNLGGSRNEGGYTASITVAEEDIEVHDGDVVVIFADDSYASTNQSFGGNAHNNPKIFFAGHIIGNSIRYDYKRTIVSFQVGSITDMMKNSEGFSVSVESKADPATWYELIDMDGRRALYHYLKWHTTVLSLADFQFVGTDQKIQFFDSDRESMFDAIDNYMRGTLLGNVTADRQGKIWAEVGAWATSNPTGSFAPVMTLQKGDWLGELEITERLFPDVSSLELGGVAYSGATTGTFSALISSAPGLVPNFRGTPEVHQGLALASQEQLNELAGNIYANKTSRFPEISVELSGNLRNLDIAPQEVVHVEASANDTNINTPIAAPYLVDSMGWRYDPKAKTLLPSVSLKSVVNGSTGETVTIPEVPEAGGYAPGGSFNFGNLTGFPPSILPASGNLQAAMRAQGVASNPTGSALREVSWVTVSPPQFNYGGFVTQTGTSSISTGTIVNQIYPPYPGVYWIYGSAEFSNLAGGQGFMRIMQDGFLVWEGYVDDSSVPVSAPKFHVEGGALMYITNTSAPITMGLAYNMVLGGAPIGNINIILLASI